MKACSHAYRQPAASTGMQSCGSFTSGLAGLRGAIHSFIFTGRERGSRCGLKLKGIWISIRTDGASACNKNTASTLIAIATNLSLKLATTYYLAELQPTKTVKAR